MQLVTWRPNVSGIWKLDDTLYLTITLSVKCGFCRAKYTFTTDRHVVRKAGINVGEFINWEMRAAFAPARCKICGMAQRLPEQEKRKLRREMEARLTPDWVKAQYARSTV